MFSDIRSGIASYRKAWNIIGELRLWDKLMIPGGISLLIFALFGYAGYMVAGPFGNWLAEVYPWDWGETGVMWFGRILSGLAIFSVSLILYKNIVLVVLSPILSALSERVEAEVLGVQRPYRGLDLRLAARAIARGLYVSLGMIIRELWYTFWLLLLGLIPVVGIAAAVTLFLVQAYYAGFGNMDFTLERYFGAAESRRFVKQNRSVAIVNGGIFLLLLAVPVVGIFIAPSLATIAATLETVKRVSVPQKSLYKGNEFV